MAAALEPPAAAGGPWQRLYAAVLRRRRGRARRTALHLPRPAISVGNLHWGGSGKTPLVAAIAAHLAASGRRVAVLSRGYRRRGADPVLVSVGAGPRVDWREAGDEPYWLASKLVGVAVAVGADRARAAALAQGAGPVDLFVLDDAFSHVRVAREVDLLAFPSSDPFGGGRLLPSGRLREPLEAAAHADAVLLGGLAPGSPDASSAGDGLARALRRFGFSGPGFSVAEIATIAADSTRQAAPGGRVVLVSGVARNERVATTAQRLSLTIAQHLAFPDHHRYPTSSLARIRRAAERHRAPVLTTAKDAMKLLGRLPGVEVLRLEIEAEPEARFWRWLDERLAAALSGRA
jgi:tetraacyldisaccharide 4'-kinase